MYEIICFSSDDIFYKIFYIKFFCIVKMIFFLFSKMLLLYILTKKKNAALMFSKIKYILKLSK